MSSLPDEKYIILLDFQVDPKTNNGEPNVSLNPEITPSMLQNARKNGFAQGQAVGIGEGGGLSKGVQESIKRLIDSSQNMANSLKNIIKQQAIKIVNIEDGLKKLKIREIQYKQIFTDQLSQLSQTYQSRIKTLEAQLAASRTGRMVQPTTRPISMTTPIKNFTSHKERS